jgi:chromosome partitioning protein
MSSLDSRHWIRIEDLELLLNKNDDSCYRLFKKIGVIPQARQDLPNAPLSLFDSQVRQALEASGFTFPQKAERIAVMMCKGGVGKTTTAYFLGKRLASYGARVLLVDCDPQSNLTMALHPETVGFTVSESSVVLVDVLTGKCSVRDAILPLSAHLHLLPSTAINSLLEKRLLESLDFALYQPDMVLQEIDGSYDYILFDCAPSLNVVNASIVCASDLVLLPIQLDSFSRSGLALTLSEISDLQREYDFKTNVRIVVNKFNPQEKLSLLYLGHLAAEYRSLMMQTAIRESDEIKVSLALQTDLFASASSKSKDDFDSLAREVLNRSNKEGLTHGEHRRDS